MTFAIFHDFSGLENGLPKFRDFPRPGRTQNKIQQTLLMALKPKLTGTRNLYSALVTLLSLRFPQIIFLQLLQSSAITQWQIVTVVI